LTRSGPGYRGGVPTFDLLDEPTWRARATAHEARVEPWIRPHLERRPSGRSHPVEDFCFTYYSYPPSRLRRWHPGAGVVLAGPSAPPTDCRRCGSSASC
jgi:hypothetical protein